MMYKAVCVNDAVALIVGGFGLLLDWLFDVGAVRGVPGFCKIVTCFLMVDLVVSLIFGIASDREGYDDKE